MFLKLPQYRNKSLIFSSVFSFFSLDDKDDVKIGSLPKGEEIDGWGRVKKMYQMDEFGDMTKELSVISQTAMLSSFVGIIYGGFMNTRTTYTDFMRNNTATSFRSSFEAKRALQDTMTKSFGKGAWKWGWRICLFSTSFVGLTTTISVYRGKNGILEYFLAGGLTGALYKWQMGPRGWIVGCGLGATLGLTTGLITYGLLALAGVSMDELRQHQNVLSDIRKSYIIKGMKEYRDEEDKLIKSHNKKNLPNYIDQEK